MESNVNGIRPGGLYAVQASGERQGRRDSKQKAFSLDAAEQASAPPDAPVPHEVLTVSHRTQEESGGKLDLTA